MDKLYYSPANQPRRSSPPSSPQPAPAHHAGYVVHATLGGKVALAAPSLYLGPGILTSTRLRIWLTHFSRWAKSPRREWGWAAECSTHTV